MSDLVQVALITIGGSVVTIVLSGIGWAIREAVKTWREADEKHQSEIADLRKIREDTLVTAIGDAKAASVQATDVATRALDISTANNRLLHEILTEWRGHP